MLDVTCFTIAMPERLELRPCLTVAGGLLVLTSWLALPSKCIQVSTSTSAVGIRSSPNIPCKWLHEWHLQVLLVSASRSRRTAGAAQQGGEAAAAAEPGGRAATAREGALCCQQVATRRALRGLEAEVQPSVEDPPPLLLPHTTKSGLLAGLFRTLSLH